MPAAAAPAPVALAGAPLAPDALLKAGFCAQDATVEDVTPLALPDGRTLLQITCTMAAYQGSFEYAWGDGTPVLVVDGGPIHAIGLPTFDVATGTLAWIEKARGAGDCGDAWSYRLSGQQLQLVEHRHQACRSSGAYVPPEQWPLVAPPASAATVASGAPAPASATAGASVTPAVPTVPLVATLGTHCAAGEPVYFSCATTRGKVISVCGGSAVHYRFGPLGSPELVYPADGAGGTFQVEERHYAQALANVLSFTNGDVRYEVTDAMGSGAGDMAESNNFRGVYVLRGEKVIATVSCSAEPLADWEGLTAAVGR